MASRNKLQFTDIKWEGLKGLYEIATNGAVRSKRYKFYNRQGRLVQGGRMLTQENNSVYLKNGDEYSWYNVGVLYFATFNKNYKEQLQARKWNRK